ncbi:MAG: DUF1844 domain-containing protein [Candidatus Poseidoniales archaeon]
MFSSEEDERFFSLIYMFQRSALLHLGLLPDQNKQIHFNLGEAREAIEMIRMLQNKTKDSIGDKEAHLLRSIISELQLQFTQAPKRQQKIEEDQAQSEMIRETFASPQNAPAETISNSAQSEEE